MKRNQTIIGDALRVLPRIEDASIDMVFYSPPYFGLRDYGAGRAELGQESTVDEWVDNQVAVARQAARVLTATGTLWINVGDSYSPGPRHGALRKSLMLAPERLALRLVEDGWILRNKVVWVKRSHLPSPVADRLTNAWEYIFVLARSPHYYFDLDAVRVPHTSLPHRVVSGRPPGRKDSRRSGDRLARTRNLLGSIHLAAWNARGNIGHPRGKNPGDAWLLTTSHYRGEHRATMPVELARRAIAAACPELRCVACRAPWQRDRVRHIGRATLRPTCLCEADVEPGIVLDPFMGSGTTAVAAKELGCDWLGIELNPEYAVEATARIERTKGSDL